MSQHPLGTGLRPYTSCRSAATCHRPSRARLPATTAAGLSARTSVCWPVSLPAASGRWPPPLSAARAAPTASAAGRPPGGPARAHGRLLTPRGREGIQESEWLGRIKAASQDVLSLLCNVYVFFESRTLSRKAILESSSKFVEQHARLRSG